MPDDAADDQPVYVARHRRPSEAARDLSAAHEADSNAATAVKPRRTAASALTWLARNAIRAATWAVQHSQDVKRRQDELAEARKALAQRRQPSAYPVTPRPRIEPLRIAYLAASPTGAARLRVDREVRDVEREIRRTLHRDAVDIRVWQSATFADLRDALNDYRPHVVHFAGHGSEQGLFFDGTTADHPDGVMVDFRLIARLMTATDSPPLLQVMNACESFVGAERLLDASVAVIAMVDEITDEAARCFATTLYAAIACGQSVVSALGQARVMIEQQTRAGGTPELLLRPGIDPAGIVLVTPPRGGC